MKTPILRKKVLLLIAFFSITIVSKAQDGTLPDNISEADCFIDPQAFDWTMKQDWVSKETNVATYQPPVVGDLDGDGLSEIVVGKLGAGSTANEGDYRGYSDIYVYKGTDRTSPVIIPSAGGNYMQLGAFGLARVPIGADTIPLIVIIDPEGYLRAYNPFKTGGVINKDDYVWMSNAAILDTYVKETRYGSVAFADFNNDGVPEVYAGNRIFNAATGVMLVDGTSTVGTKATSNTLNANILQYFPAVADIDGDEQAEYIAGMYVYEVNIPNTAGDAGNAFTLVAQMDPVEVEPGYTVAEGYTMLADINKDSHLDVVMVRHYPAGKHAIVVWDMQTMSALGSYMESNTVNPGHGGLPFIGDVDADGNLEIVKAAQGTSTTGWLYGYRWDGASSLTRVYVTANSDGSASTGMTLFDFNQDGTPELVYRDETDLRVMTAVPGTNGNAGAFENLITIPAGSGTYIEYPVVADVDNDGSAEIVVVGGAGRGATAGTVRIYKGDIFPWAPARKVWNQYAYYAVNVNEDLTIPKVQFNSATIFPGQDGVLGNGDDVRPYNAFLQQQTILNKNGTPLFVAPDIQWSSNPALTYHADGDSVKIDIRINNAGDAGLQAPVYISIYKDAVAASNLVHTTTYPNTIYEGDTVQYSFVIRNFSSQLPADQLFINLNDRGNTVYYHPECDTLNNTHSAKVSPLPDNISDADCWTDPVKTIWDIEEKTAGDTNIHYLATIFAGDLDKDGRIEVVAPNAAGTAASNGILIFNDSLTLKRSITTPSAPQGYTTNLLIADVDNDSYGELIIGGNDNQLYCYSHLGVEKWRTSVGMTRSGDPSLIAADVNGDGYAEILGVNQIYDGSTGDLLVTLPAGGRGFSSAGPLSHMSVFADFDGDGSLEVASGNTVYKITITNRAGTAGNSAVVLAQMPAPLFDGFTSVADIDMDGDLDVIVTGGGACYVWDGATPTQIGNTLQITTGVRISRAFAGDITGDGAPDIAYTYTNRIEAYRYDKGSNTFVQLWSKATSDSSGATTMSMFDFDQDGQTELVYRDMTHLRIINKDGNDMASIPCFSATHTEYPTVVDLDRDGHADILVSGGYAASPSSGIRVRHFGSATPGQWAPARKVWNQHAYNAVNINEDLTIPKVQFNPATVFPGLDGVLGTGDDVRPYNAFLQQQTTLNEDGTPLFLAPDIQWSSSPVLTYYTDGDSMKVDIQINNSGDAGLQAPAYISVYKDAVEASNRVLTTTYPDIIYEGETVQYSFVIRDFSSQLPLDQLFVNLNDSGNAVYYQPECDTLNNTNSVKVGSSGFDDYYGAYNDGAGAITVLDVLANDVLDLTQANEITSMTSSAGSSLAVVPGAIESLGYTPPVDFLGIDTVSYTASGVDDQSRPVFIIAKAYIYVFSNHSSQCYDPSGEYPVGINDTGLDVSVQWKLNPGGTDANTLTTSAPYGVVTFSLLAEVSFQVSTTPVAAFNNDIATPFVLEITPLQMYWDQSALNNNWNDPNNWLTVGGAAVQSVPLSCTSVHIPGNADNYPSLDSLSSPRTIRYGAPQCDSIVFHFGAEVAKPNYLSYNKALIQYNVGYYNSQYDFQLDGDPFSATPMQRGRWYALAAPLKKIVTGDFSFGGKPNSWQQGFVRSESDGNFTGNWVSPSNDNAIPLDGSLTNAISLWVGEYTAGLVGEGEGYQDGLNGLNGVIEIPYFENSLSSLQHRIHHYDGTASKFDYYYYQVPDVPIESAHPQGSITRGDESYRFIFDGEIMKVPSGVDQDKDAFRLRVPAATELMVGNPLMSSLDFDKFYEANQDRMDSYFRLYVNNVWEEYSYELGSESLSPYIAPLQAFFITTTGNPGDSTDLYFPFESVSVNRPSGESLQLRSGETVTDVLYVTARDGEGNSNSVSLGVNGVSGDDAVKLFYENENARSVPQLYLGDDQTGRKAIESVDEGLEQIPLGISGALGKEIELTFTNQENLGVKAVILYDMQIKNFVNLLENNTYSFQNSGAELYNDRFLLLIKRFGTSILPQETAGKTGVSVIDRTLCAYSDEPIRSIRLYNAQGVMVHSGEGINQRTYSEHLYLPAGMYIVKVALASGSNEVVKIIIR